MLLSPLASRISHCVCCALSPIHLLSPLLDNAQHWLLLRSWFWRRPWWWSCRASATSNKKFDEASSRVVISGNGSRTAERSSYKSTSRILLRAFIKVRLSLYHVRNMIITNAPALSTTRDAIFTN